jgi:glutathionyl-hydroquinone reductase
MGLLVDGTWQDQWYDTSKTGGRFVRQESRFRDHVDSHGAHPPVAGRYHLYVAMACPWAHRTLIVRALKGLGDAISVSTVHSDMMDRGWEFREGSEGSGLEDGLFGSRYLHQVYTRADPKFSGRVTVPILWDRAANTIVNNESSEILRMLNGPLAQLGDPSAHLAGHDLYPAALQREIEAVNADVYPNLNNGVYRAGFATTQEAYEEAVEAVFACMARLESRLARRTWLVGETLTEADIRLFTTLVRFDLVYYAHFKCSRRRLQDHPNLWRHTRSVFQLPGVAATVDIASIRRHYFYSHESINPSRVVPVCPDIDFEQPL